jgi:hypothetical protein
VPVPANVFSSQIQGLQNFGNLLSYLGGSATLSSAMSALGPDVVRLNDPSKGEIGS